MSSRFQAITKAAKRATSRRAGRTTLVALMATAVVAATASISVAAGPLPSTASAAAADASSGRIVYVCGQDLCSIDPEGGGPTQITTDAGGYYRPSISADGTRIAAARGLDVVAGDYGSNLTESWATGVEGLKDVAISPDGTSVAVAYWYSKLELKYSYVCGGLCLTLVYYNGNDFYAAPGAAPTSHTGDTGTGFLGAGLLSRDYESGTYDSDLGAYVGSEELICLVANPADENATCDRRVAEPAIQGGREVQFSDPSGSPDGTLIAAVLGFEPEADGANIDNVTGETPVVNIYNAATGAKISTLPGIGLSPSFSPDGSQVVYQGTDGWIYVAPAAGGAATRLVQGTHPTWGGAKGQAQTTAQTTTAAVVAKSRGALPVRGRTVTLKLNCAKDSASACVGKVSLSTAQKKKAKTLSASKRYRVAPGKKAKVRVNLTKKGLKRLKPGRTTKVAVMLKTSDGSTSRTVVKLKRPR